MEKTQENRGGSGLIREALHVLFYPLVLYVAGVVGCVGLFFLWLGEVKEKNER
jgi:hypothetical protein